MDSVVDMERLIQVEQHCKSNEHRIRGLEEQGKILGKLVTSVELMAHNIERMTKEMAEQNTRLASLEREPAERWNSVKRTIFTTMMSTLAGGLVGALLAVILK